MAGTKKSMTDQKAAAQMLVNRPAAELLAMAEALEWVDTAYNLDIRLQRDLHADARTLRAQAATKPAAPEPVAVLYVGREWGQELQDWEIEANQKVCERLNEQHVGNPTTLSLYTHPDERVVLLESALKRILDEPNNTMSDGKALKEIIRIARAALEGK